MTAAFIDEMREAFGKESIDSAIRAGLAGEGAFHASENGQEIGSKPRDIPGQAINGHHQARATPCGDCKHYKVRVVSPDGYRLTGDCVRFRCLAIQRCADWAAK